MAWSQNQLMAHKLILMLPLIGLGLLEAIPERDILANQDIEDRNHDGISGKANMQGRFTWKASVPSLKQQIANAANNDMGLKNPLYPNENCTKNQKDCLNAPKGRDDIIFANGTSKRD